MSANAAPSAELQQLQQQLRAIVARHVNLQETKVVIFGSWARGNQKNYSDVDLGFLGKDPLPAETLAELEQDFENSNLPQVVEVVDFSYLPEAFKKHALKQHIVL